MDHSMHMAMDHGDMGHGGMDHGDMDMGGQCSMNVRYPILFMFCVALASKGILMSMLWNIDAFQLVLEEPVYYLP
jgi:copper transporter 1